MTRSEQRHYKAVRALFPRAAKLSLQALAIKLEQLEHKAHKLAEALCSDPSMTQDKYDTRQEAILNDLDLLLGFRALGVPVFVDGDPRGYGLKIDDAYVRAHGLRLHVDWGGYGILAPERSKPKATRQGERLRALLGRIDSL